MTSIGSGIDNRNSSRARIRSHQFSLLHRVDASKNATTVDLFAGGGGASTGIEAATGVPVDVAVDHDAIAIRVHEDNHRDTLSFRDDIWKVDPRKATGGRRVKILWASPDCCHFSRAKGGKPRKQNIRSLAWAVVRWASAVKPECIFVENVREFETWGPLDGDGQPIKARMGESFNRWKRRLEQLGYVVDHRVLDASHFGAPTRRKRLFIVARRDGRPIVWPNPTHGPGLKHFRTAAKCIDWSLPCPSIFERKRPLADKTLWRIAQGLKRFVLENPEPFIISIDHQSTRDTAASADEPMRTVTAKARLGLVTVKGVDYQIVDIGLRMLTPAELLRAQFGRFAKKYDLSSATTTRDKVRLIGNSVAPEVAEALVRSNIARREMTRIRSAEAA